MHVQATGTWARLEEMKAVVCEPRGTVDAFDAVMADFYAAIRDGRGAIFFAICRGKVAAPQSHLHDICHTGPGTRRAKGHP